MEAEEDAHECREQERRRDSPHGNADLELGEVCDCGTVWLVAGSIPARPTRILTLSVHKVLQVSNT